MKQFAGDIIDDGGKLISESIPKLYNYLGIDLRTLLTNPQISDKKKSITVKYGEDIDVEAAGGTPTLIDDSKPSNSGKKTNNPPPLISSPATGATPPPPPSFATSPTPGAATAGSNTGSSNNTNNSVPQLF